MWLFLLKVKQTKTFMMVMVILDNTNDAMLSRKYLKPNQVRIILEKYQDKRSE